jgi:nondiscriminating aspartyl-tRNA synthetase
MKRTHIKNISEETGKEIVVKGFVHGIRDQGGIKFILLRDISGIGQIVVLKKNPEVFTAVSELTLESVVEINGTVKEEEQAPGGFEIVATSLTILSKAEPELPIPVVVEKGGEEIDITKRLDWRWIDLRRTDNIKIFKLWTALERGVRKYVENNDFIQVYGPSFTGAPSESGADVFEVTYFEGKAYLPQSPQFYKQMAMAAGFEKVFMTGTCFRAEPSFTTRHTTEFTGWDLEISYIDSHHDVMDELEKFLVAGFKQVEEELALGIPVPSIPFPRVTMAEAKEKLAKAGIASKADHDVSPEEERELFKIIKEEEGHDFVFLIDWPKEGRPFYHMRYEDKPEITKSFDLLYKGVEVVTGSQREHRYDVLKKQAAELKIPTENLKHYFNFFKYGCPPHGGIGFGPGRLIQFMLDLPSVKEATFLPRDVKRLTP